MKKIIYVSDKEAQVTKAFAKNASVYGTEEFKLWREYKTIYSEAQMVVKTIKKNPNKKTRRNMTYANMEEFIKTLDNSEALLAQFGIIRQRSQIQKSPYQYVLNWFEAAFANEIALKDFVEQKEEARTQTDVAKSA